MRFLLALMTAACLLACPDAAGARPLTNQQGPLFETAQSCMACHNGLMTPKGEDVSIGSAWRASMMANSARDPYWQAGVRREIIDHPTAQKTIENECSRCHMPMARFEAKAAGGSGDGLRASPHRRRCGPRRQARGGRRFLLAVPPDRKREAGDTRELRRRLRDRYDARRAGSGSCSGRTRRMRATRRVMRTSTGGFDQAHERRTFARAEVCATCHTLHHQSARAGGRRHRRVARAGADTRSGCTASYREKRSCQDRATCRWSGRRRCRSPACWAAEDGAFAARVRGRQFLHAARCLNRYPERIGRRGAAGTRLELAAVERTASPSCSRTAARVSDRSGSEVRGGRLEAEVTIENLGGHKLPTAYPSRRVWLHCRGAGQGTTAPCSNRER